MPFTKKELTLILMALANYARNCGNGEDFLERIKNLTKVVERYLEANND